MRQTRHLLSSLLFLSVVLLSAGELCHPDDKRALLQIKSHFDNAYFFNSWRPDTDCCVSWNGIIQCNETTHRPNLTGPIPPSIARLTNLEYLTLTWNNLTGPVPSFLGKLEKLIFLHLSFNNFHGSIPSSLSNLCNLGSIRLDRNKLTGTIPSSLSAIRGNDLYLILSHNGLSGKIPESFKDVDFGQVDVSRNKLEGNIFMFFRPNKTTQIMDFSRNQFEFDMSKLEVYNNLIAFDINHNKIYGSIPVAMTGLRYLQNFNVSYNRLCGRIPVGGSLQRFDYTTYFHNRCLCGAPLNVTCS
ncbi:hypothetical protein CDL15_Pgr002248 [Punica granatum]|uniref:Leucine-rich repeat-containing N-terminal plant-type domain-containing protein n=1 Tax=Punica granatum TaxID=22663 RepID=A0A218XCL0_PUNGR|nr:hypothetical protein CDL15_Pgr002248 [Punica granatum]PKI54204.1 hypothetical protein CRG98_025437 [Punica granatum]